MAIIPRGKLERSVREWPIGKRGYIPPWFIWVDKETELSWLVGNVIASKNPGPNLARFILDKEAGRLKAYVVCHTSVTFIPRSLTEWHFDNRALIPIAEIDFDPGYMGVVR